MGIQWELSVNQLRKPEQKKGLASTANFMGFCWAGVREESDQLPREHGTDEASFGEHESDKG